jgi:hypothetical protein
MACPCAHARASHASPPLNASSSRTRKRRSSSPSGCRPYGRPFRGCRSPHMGGSAPPPATPVRGLRPEDPAAAAPPASRRPPARRPRSPARRARPEVAGGGSAIPPAAGGMKRHPRKAPPKCQGSLKGCSKLDARGLGRAPPNTRGRPRSETAKGDLGGQESGVRLRGSADTGQPHRAVSRRRRPRPHRPAQRPVAERPARPRLRPRPDHAGRGAARGGLSRAAGRRGAPALADLPAGAAGDRGPADPPANAVRPGSGGAGVASGEGVCGLRCSGSDATVAILASQWILPHPKYQSRSCCCRMGPPTMMRTPDLVLGSEFQMALEHVAKGLLASGAATKLAVEDMVQLLASLREDARTVLAKNLRGCLQQLGPPSPLFLQLFGDEVREALVSHADPNDVRLIFRPIMLSGNEVAISFIERALTSRPEIILAAPPDDRTNFVNTLRELASRSEEARESLSARSILDSVDADWRASDVSERLQGTSDE